MYEANVGLQASNHDWDGLPARKKAFFQSWTELFLFLRANPIIGTFKWTSLTEQAIKDELNGLTKETSFVI